MYNVTRLIDVDEAHRERVCDSLQHLAHRSGAHRNHQSESRED